MRNFETCPIERIFGTRENFVLPRPMGTETPLSWRAMLSKPPAALCCELWFELKPRQLPSGAHGRIPPLLVVCYWDSSFQLWQDCYDGRLDRKEVSKLPLELKRVHRHSCGEIEVIVVPRNLRTPFKHFVHPQLGLHLSWRDLCDSQSITTFSINYCFLPILFNVHKYCELLLAL